MSVRAASVFGLRRASQVRLELLPGDVTPTSLLGEGGRCLEGTAASQVDQQGSQQDGGVGKATDAAQRTLETRLLLPVRRQELAHQRPVIQFLNACIGVHPQDNTEPGPDSQALSERIGWTTLPVKDGSRKE